MSFVAAVTIKTATLSLWADALAGGSLACYSDVQPASPISAPNGVLLGTVPLPVAAGSISVTGQNVLLVVDPDPALYSAGGAVGWVRALDATGAPVFDAEAGLPGSGAAAVFDLLDVAAGGEIDVYIALGL